MENERAINTMTAAEIEADNNRIDNFLTLKKEKKKKQNDYYYSIVKTRMEKEKQHVFKKLCKVAKYKGINITPLQMWSIAKKQKCKCPYSGRRLQKGNIHLDHIIPKSKGGSDNISNLQLLPAEINNMKFNFLSDDFIGMCKEVASYQTPTLKQTYFPFSYL